MKATFSLHGWWRTS
ncbi:trp operon leader peptide [Citrobacter amalonaticus]